MQACTHVCTHARAHASTHGRIHTCSAMQAYMHAWHGTSRDGRRALCLILFLKRSHRRSYHQKGSNTFSIVCARTGAHRWTHAQTHTQTGAQSMDTMTNAHTRTDGRTDACACDYTRRHATPRDAMPCHTTPRRATHTGMHGTPAAPRCWPYARRAESRSHLTAISIPAPT